MNFNKILTELCWRLEDGTPDLKNPKHLDELKTVLVRNGTNPKLIKALIKNLTDGPELNEGRSRGETLEEFIVAAANGNPPPETSHDIPPDAGENIMVYLKKNGVSGKADVLGASTLGVTSEWSSFWEGGKVPGATKTPKTDLTVGGVKISLKGGGSGQLMSGGKNESKATFNAAVDAVGGLEDKLYNSIVTSIEGLASTNLTKGTLGSAIKAQTDELVNVANKSHKSLMSDLDKLFANNNAIRDAFAYEAMSGDQKFGKSSKGSCTHILNSSFDGKKNNLHALSDSGYISKIASQMKLSVRFKSTSQKSMGEKTGYYRYWSVIGLIADNLNENLSNYAEGELLTEGVITDILSKLKKFIKSIISKVKKYIKKSIQGMVEFLGADYTVSVNNNIKF
tara:strand:- start:392 stop:1579 length:1188 start_codon:yes stop_codon:yes gene_type:complete